MRYKALKRLSLVLSMIIFLTWQNQALAEFNKAGRTSLQFLKIGIGARAAGMGEACIADLKGVNSVFWNPGGLTEIPTAEAAFDYASWIGDLSIMSAAAGYNIDGIGAFAVSYVGLNYGDLDEALVISASGGIDSRTGNTFSGSDMAAGFSFARRFLDNLSIGVNVKYVQEELYSYKASLWAIDVGSYYDTGWRGIRIGMAAQNFAKQARFMQTKQDYEQSYDIPLLFRLGFSIDLAGGSELFLGGDPDMHALTINVDALHSNDYAERLHMGLEYRFLSMFAIRSGYRFNYEEGQISLGGGINYQAADINFRFDYAYVDYDFLDSTHRFSIILSY